MSGGKTAGAGDGAPKKKRSVAKLAILVLAPLMLAGSGYAGWAMFLAGPGDEHVAEAAHEPPAPAIDYAVAAEVSYTYTLALSVMLNKMCGTRTPKALEAEAAHEMQSDGRLVHLSWEAAYRRMGTLGASSCDLMVSEIMQVDDRAYAAQLAAAEAAKKAAGGH